MSIAFSDLSIKKRLVIGFGAIALVLVGSTLATAIVTGSHGSEILAELGILAVDLAIAGGIAFAVVRSITGPLGSMAQAIDQLAEGTPNIDVPGVDRKDEFGDLARHVQTISARGSGFRRIKVALDSCTTNVMVADADYNIVYLNQSLDTMLSEAETELRKELPQFDVKKLHGENIDVFHKNPAHQRALLDNLRATYSTNLSIGSLSFDLIATPIFDDGGQRTGTVVEWADRTAEHARDREIKTISEDNMRIKVALDNCTTNVMVADADYNIVYLNQSLDVMLSEAEAELRKELPRFDVKKLHGENIDVFHKNPAHQRALLDNLRAPYRANLSIGSLSFDLIASPIFDDAGQRTGTVVEWADRTAEHARDREVKTVFEDNARIKVALDNCTTNVMVADPDCNIVYMNQSVTEMMKAAEQDLRKELTQFDTSKLIGANIDIFHKNPAHQRSMLEKLSSTYSTNIKVAGRVFNLIANPVLDDDGKRLGSVVEWKDITQEQAVETEVNTMVSAAVNGNFGERITLEGKSGFMLSLAEAMNRLCETTGAALDDVSVNLGAMAEGDLNKRITNAYSGSFDELKNKLNETSERLNEIVTDVVVGANEITSASSEITAGTNDLSQRTEQQASNLEETAASMEEIASTIKQNADNAQQANQLAISARTVATDGGDVVSKAVVAMSQIETSSQKISDIIGVIDEIAFQTNLLALNAAVEAARAGDAGKGFAVVASEVRSLAQRSSEAAKDIKGLIVESGSQVKDGVTLVNNAGTSLTEIVDSVKRVTDIVSEIAAASAEQSSGVEEVNKAIGQMDEMTQQNSALVEENAAACRLLQEQAENMHQRMSFFSVNTAATSERKPTRRREAMQRPMPTIAPKVAAAGGGGGGVAAIQADLQSALSQDDDWKDF